MDIIGNLLFRVDKSRRGLDSLKAYANPFRKSEKADNRNIRDEQFRFPISQKNKEIESTAMRLG